MTQSSAEAVPEPPIQIPAGPLRRWLVMHDDQWTFIVPYIGLAVLLSALISLFWLVVVVAVHFALEDRPASLSNSRCRARWPTAAGRWSCFVGIEARSGAYLVRAGAVAVS